MSDPKNKTSLSKTNGTENEPFDRQDYFKTIRNEFLAKIGLPPDTKPGQVVKILEIKKELDLIKRRKMH